jgi:hypothetical protein
VIAELHRRELDARRPAELKKAVVTGVELGQLDRRRRRRIHLTIAVGLMTYLT